MDTTKDKNAGERIIVALDYADLKTAEELVRYLKGIISFFKVGLELFTSSGPGAVKMVTENGAKVFLDLKFHDIPNTVVGAVSSALNLSVSMLNVHAAGGEEMMRAAAKTAAESENRPKLLAVTVLTSIDEEGFRQIGFSGSIGDSVVNLAKSAKNSGLDGVVCSPNEIRPVREILGADFLIVTPGVRPTWSQKDDQRRVMTPAEALNAGADYIVIGRPITADKDPRRAAERIIEDVDGENI
ncbi:MAG: orotidine-5'-phosphate decarboxylase [Deltaproteobacteria bacterium]|uniref:Orotidine 5'-phosphate decarboxylase n=1 Tax=Candidatus Zymogenus saltonus TaxID=2844893 RepID=A0A9D8KCT1_9DELT|nr:orotidine-5'-phosphate decarboxylase [Candidatus Zymogenus saltonus]